MPSPHTGPAEPSSSVLNIRCLMILMTLVFVLLTGAVSTVLAVLSGDDALHTLRETNDATVAQCFETGSEVILSATGSFLEEKADRVHEYVRLHQDMVERNALLMSSYFSTVPPDRVFDASWYEAQRGFLWSLLNSSMHITIVGVITRNKQLELLSRRGSSDVLRLFASNGSRSFFSDTKPILGTTVDLACSYHPFQDSGPCNLTQSLVNYIVSSVDIDIPLGKFVWGPIEAQATHTGSHYYTSFGAADGNGSVFVTPETAASNGRVGVVVASVDLRNIEQFVKQVKLKTELGRIFIVVGGGQNQTGLLVAGSHGTSTRPGFLNFDGMGKWPSVEPINATESTDELIRNTAQWVEDKGRDAQDPYRAAWQRQEARGGVEDVVLQHEGGAVEFLVRVKPIERGTVWWWVVILLDRRSQVGRMEATHNKSMAAVDETIEEVNERLWDDRAQLYGVVIGVACLFVVLTVLVTMWIIRPLNILRSEMAVVATMHLDSVPERSLSSLSEVRSMQESFYTMISCLKEFRQYMPQAIIIECSESDQDDAEDADLEGAESGSATSGSQPPLQGDSFRKYTATTHSKDSKDKEKRPGLLAVQLSRKRTVSQVMLSLRNFKSLQRDPTRLIEVHSRWVGALAAEARDCRGTIERFVGDRVDVNFGGLSFCNAVAAKAATFVVRVKEFFASVREIKPAMGLGTGTALVGNLGCTGLKTSAVLGQAVALSHVAHTVAREIGLTTCICARSAEECKGNFSLLPIDIIQFDGRKQVVHHIAGVPHQTALGGEWMYTYDVQLNGPYDMAWKRLLTGKIDEAAHLFGVIDDDIVAPAVARRLLSFLEKVPKEVSLVEYYWVATSQGCCTIPGPMHTDRATSMGTPNPLTPSDLPAVPSPAAQPFEP